VSIYVEPDLYHYYIIYVIIIDHCNDL
jgi:hypothetical protein